MDTSLQELIGTSQPRQILSAGIRLLCALLAGALIGAQREYTGKPAGLRTHVLVALGTTIVVVGAAQYGMHEDAMSRVIQGLVTGIGFLGAGTILKLQDQREIKGLTTAASIWMIAAISVVIGLGQLILALLGTLLAWVVLTVFVKLEDRQQ